MKRAVDDHDRIRKRASTRDAASVAYAASHDLQEPLRMVSSYLTLLEQRYTDELDPDGREFLAFSIDGANRMWGTIDGLLEYSRVETKGEPFERVDLEDVRTDLQFLIGESNAGIDGLVHASGRRRVTH